MSQFIEAQETEEEKPSIAKSQQLKRNVKIDTRRNRRRNAQIPPIIAAVPPARMSATLDMA